MLTTLANTADTIRPGGLWMPEAASSYAEPTDWVFMFIFWVSAFFFVVIGVCMFYFAWKYRMRQGDENNVSHGSHHNNTLEITWSVIPLLIVLLIFFWGFRGFLDMRTPPDNAYEIQVTARKWSWEFTYPEGKTSPYLHIPAETPVRLVLNSQDVIHSLFIPQFRAKQDVVPGRWNTMWFEAKWDPSSSKFHQSGPIRIEGTQIADEFENVLVYDLYCTEYCGTRHSWMLSSVIVHTPAAFREWVTAAPEYDTLPEWGQAIVNQRGCAACHSVDGSPGQGPTFRNLFGRERQFVNGETRVADEQYISDSVRTPARQIVQGYPNVMPPFNLSPDEMNAVVAFMKSISENYRGTLEDINREHGGEAGEQPAPDSVEVRRDTELPPQVVPDSPDDRPSAQPENP